jgi:DNA-binding XRE family transcriptional regulator
LTFIAHPVDPNAMRVPAPAEALRVARALLDISQRVAAERAEIMQKSVSAAETSKTILLETNLALVDCYRRQGIEFLGEGSVGEPIKRCGARWRGPDSPYESRYDGTELHSEASDVSFKAARALLGKEQSDIADYAGLSVDAIKALERGDGSRKTYDLLRGWYEDQGAEFTGWGDVATRRYFGVGVRWRT